LTEIIDGNLRWYYATSRCTYIEPFWIQLGAFQAAVNIIGCVAIVTNLELCIPLSASLVWLAIVGINLFQLLNDAPVTEKTLEFLINLFGYFAIIRFWSAHQEITDNNHESPLKTCTPHVLAILHIILSASIMSFIVRSALVCNIASTDAIGALLEMLLLGYIFAYLRLDKEFRFTCGERDADPVAEREKQQSEERKNKNQELA